MRLAVEKHLTAPDPVKFSKRLNQAMTQAGVPDKDFSRAALIAPEFKVSVQAAQNWIAGVKTPAAIHALMLAKRFGADFCWLYFGERQNADPPPAPLTYEEEQLLARWRSATPAARQAISLLLPMPQKKMTHDRTYSRPRPAHKHRALAPLLAAGLALGAWHSVSAHAAPSIESDSEVACTALVNTGIAERCALEGHNLVAVSPLAPNELQAKCAKIASQLDATAHYPDGWLVFYSPVSTHPVASCPLK